jgi:hypothetical protein
VYCPIINLTYRGLCRMLVDHEPNGRTDPAVSRRTGHDPHVGP